MSTATDSYGIKCSECGFPTRMGSKIKHKPGCPANTKPASEAGRVMLYVGDAGGERFMRAGFREGVWHNSDGECVFCGEYPHRSDCVGSSVLREAQREVGWWYA